MRYELKNLGPGAFYCVEVAKLVKPGESVRVNKVDEGTRRLAEGPKPRLAIIDLLAAAQAKKAQPKSPVAPAPKPESTAPANTTGKGKDAPKPAPAPVPRAPDEDDQATEPAAPTSADLIK
jgi:hypothetical protein